MIKKNSTSALLRGGFADGRDGERLHARARRVAVLLRKAWVDHKLRGATASVLGSGVFTQLRPLLRLVARLAAGLLTYCKTCHGLRILGICLAERSLKSQNAPKGTQVKSYRPLELLKRKSGAAQVSKAATCNAREA